MALTQVRNMDTLSVVDQQFFGDMDLSTTSNPWEKFFGKPNAPITTNPFARQSNQNYALPDAYKGRNEYLGEMVVESILTGDQFLTQRVLPIKKTDQLSITWDIWHFNGHSTDTVPEEAPSRLVRSSMDSRTAGLVRNGLALELEHGFMKTERGRMNYLYNIRQIIHAVTESANFDIITALLNADDYNHTWAKNHGHYTRKTTREKLEREKDLFACLQKDPLGFEKLDARVVEEQNRYRGRGDTWLVPPILKGYVNFQPRNTDFYMSGKPFNMDSVDGHVGTISGSVVYALRQYEIQEADVQAITLRRRQIGGYQTMFDRTLHASSDRDAYNSVERSIDIYDEDQDAWVTISLRQAIENCALFDLSESPEGPIAPVNRPDFLSPSYDDDLPHDPFCMVDEATQRRVPIRFWGQMKVRHLTPATVLAVARSVLRAAGISEKDREELNALFDMVLKTRDESNETSHAKLLTHLGNATREAYSEVSSKRAARLARPPGNQIYKVANSASSISNLMSNASFQALISKLRILLPGAVFTDGRYASAHQLPLDTVVSIENLLGFDGLRVWHRQSQATNTTDIDKTNETILRTTMEQVVNLFGVDQALVDKFYANIFFGIKVVEVDAKTTRAKQFELRTQLVFLVQQALLTSANLVALKETIKKIETGLTAALQKTTATEIDNAATWTDIAKCFPGTMDAAVQRAADLVRRVPLDKPMMISAAMDISAADDKSFVITNLILNPAQVRTFVASIVGGNGTALIKDTQLQVTISNPLKPDQPLATVQEIISFAGVMEEHLAAYEVNMQDARTLPLLRMLARSSSSSGAATSSFKRRAVTAIESGRSGRRIAMYGEEDAMDLDDDVGTTYARISGSEGPYVYNVDETVQSLNCKRFRKQYEALSVQAAPGLLLFVAKVFLSTPVTRKALLQMADNNIRVPMNFLLARSHMNYMTHLAIKVQSGGETGNFFVGHVDFEVGDDPRVKKHHGHLTLYQKAIVTRAENVYKAFDIFVASTEGGCGTKFVKPEDYDPASHKYGGDIVVLPISVEEMDRDIPNPMDVSGHFRHYYDEANLDRDDDKKPHYSTAARMNGIFGFRKANSMASQMQPIFDRSHPLIQDPGRQPAAYNTTNWKDAEWYYDPVTRKHTIEHESTGHFGEFVGPGCRAYRNGAITTWKKPRRWNGTA